MDEQLFRIIYNLILKFITPKRELK